MRSLLAAVALALLLAPAAASSSQANPVLAAAKRSEAARSSTLTIDAVTSVTGSGSFRFSGTGAQKGTSVRMNVVGTSGGRRFTMSVVGLSERGSYVMYMRSSLFTSLLPPGKSWLRIDVEREGAKLGIDFSSLLGSSQSTTLLEDGLVSWKRLGTGVVAGQSATRYRVVVDYRKAAAKNPHYAKQLAAVERAAGVRLARGTQDVWIGRDGRFRRIRFTTPTAAGGARATTTQTMTVTGYDMPVSIEAPKRSATYSPPS